MFGFMSSSSPSPTQTPTNSVISTSRRARSSAGCPGAAPSSRSTAGDTTPRQRRTPQEASRRPHPLLLTKHPLAEKALQSLEDALRDLLAEAPGLELLRVGAVAHVPGLDEDLGDVGEPQAAE